MAAAAPDPAPRRPRGARLLATAASAAVATGCGAMLAAPRLTSSPPSVAFLGGFLLSAVVVLGLPVVPLRAGVLLTVGGAAFLVVLRGSTVAAGATAPLIVLAWATASVAALALAERSTLERHPVLPGAGPSSGWGDTAAGVAATLLVGLLLAAAIAPTLGDADRSGPLDGATPDAGAGEAAPALLRSTPSLDLTVRPRASDRVVLTVRADRPAFWRGQTFDTWDGDTWTTSAGGGAPVGSTIPPDPYDVGARTGDRFTQRFTVEAPYADLLFAAASPVEIRNGTVTYGHPDGTASSAPLGRGAGYTVVSRRLPVTAGDLRAATGPVPEGLLGRYAVRPETTRRVRDAARRVTAGASTTYDMVRAIEAWMAGRTEYSLDAPTSPPGSDAVDAFLFGTRRGWCEQIATSLVVMLRTVGVPARLATGYVPGEPNSLWGTFTVRERDAHAWAEVWFPGVGWQAFDPTAGVPLAGEAPRVSVAGWLADHRPMVLGALVLAALAGVAVFLVRSGRLRRAVARGSRTWSGRAVARLEGLGARTRPRRPAETATAYGAVLASHLDDRRLARIGRILDEELFAGTPVPDTDRAFADATLKQVAGAQRRRRRADRRARLRRMVARSIVRPNRA